MDARILKFRETQSLNNMVFSLLFSENIDSIRRHKVRTVLTGIGITWGMFILILLLGIGNSFQNGILGLFDEYDSNSIWITTGWIGKYVPNGPEIGTQVKFNDATINSLVRTFPEIEHISAEISLNEFSQIVYNDRIGNFKISGLEKDYNIIKQIKLSDGRFLNNDDFKNSRRVVVIGEQVRHSMFANEDAIGKNINIDDIPFLVIGVMDNNSILGGTDDNSVFMPSTTAINTFRVSNEYSRIGLLIKETDDINLNLDKSIRKCISRVLSFDSEDYGALYINNVQLQVKSFNILFDGIRNFLWFVGICILLCGAIGVSNTMLLATKERTKEFGIRKALGATADSIMYMVLNESIMITITFGLVGICLGYGAIGIYCIIRDFLPDDTKEILGEGSVNFSVVIFAFIVLLICGILAGAYPAHKASHIPPIKALSQE